MKEIKVYDHRLNAVVHERVYGEKWLKRAYSWPVLKHATNISFIQKLVSRIIGKFKHSARSAKTVAAFVDIYGINLDEYEVPTGGYRSFNEFFIRKKKTIKFSGDPKAFCSPCDSRLSITKIEKGVPHILVKGVDFALPDLLGKHSALCPREGWALVFRLCPTDYHRFHFVDAGGVEPTLMLGTKLHSVNPWAIQKKSHIFEWNERQLTIQHSDNFGDIVYLEVGALGVGRIHQTYNPAEPVKRGQEKGYFAFGGSTLVLLVSKRVEIDPFITLKISEGLEFLTQVGDNLGSRASTGN